MSNPQSPAIISLASSNSTPSASQDASPIIHPSPVSATGSTPPAVTFATPSRLPQPRPKKSVKRRPPTPGGPSSVNAFQKVAKTQLLHPHHELPNQPSTSSSSRAAPTSFRLGRAAPTLSATARDGALPLTSPSGGTVQRDHAPRPHRRVPSRLNLGAISNHASSTSHTHNEQLRSPTSPPAVSPRFPGPHVPSAAQEPVRSEVSPASNPGHPGPNPKRRGTIDSEDSPDGQSVTSANLDSPSTKAMMERLLSAPDYFALHGSRDIDDDDDSSESLRFAKVGEDRENENEHEDRRLRNVREQRERSKIQKLLGSDVGDSTGNFSRARPVDGFWSDPDFQQGASTENPQTGGPASPSWRRKRSVPSSFKAFGPSSPKGTGVGSPTIPSFGGPRANERYDNPQERLLLPRVSQDSRNRSTSKEPNPSSPPASPRERYLSADSDRHPRVHALDALRPTAASVKRSKTVSGAIVTSHSNPEPIIPPPRISSRNALDPRKDTAGGHVGKEAGIDARTRVKPSKSAKTLSISQSEPHHPPTPAGVIVEEYKRQILDTQKATPSTKESRRLSALQWMIEQTKSVTRGRSASASVPPSPHSSNQSMSPSFSATNFTRSPAIARARTGPPATTAEQHLSPASFERGALIQALPSPMSIGSANNSSSSLLSPEARFGRPAPVYPTTRQRARGEALSPVLASAGAQPPDSPWDGSSSLLVPGSPRSEGHQSSETGHYVPARSHPGYWSSGEAKGGDKEKRGMVYGLGKKLSKKKLNKRKEEAAEADGQDSQARSRARGRSGTRDGGAQSDTSGQRLPRRGVSVDRPQALRHRKSLRLSIDKFADDGLVSQSPSSFHGAPSPAHRSISSPGQGSPQIDTPTKPLKKESGGSKHFWKFVKRIGSSGGLRDKYQSNPYVAMPAPPAHNPESFHPRVTAEVDGNQALSRGRRSSVGQLTSLGSTPAKTPASTPGLKHASSSVDGHNSYYAHSKAQHQNINTRTSTLASSDPASSSRVFQRTHSSRSSESSVIEYSNPPPLPAHPPSAFLAQRFGPRTGDGLYSDGAYRQSPGRTLSLRTRKSSNNTTKTATEEDWMASEVTTPASPPSLPTPPRRPKPAISTSLEDVRSRPEEASDVEPESPLIPVFTVDNAINQFKPRKRSDAYLDERFATPLSTSTNIQPAQHFDAFPVVSSPSVLSRSSSVPPPPRPARDARRLVSPQTPQTPSYPPNQDSSSSGDSGTTSKGKLKKSNSRSKKDKSSAGYPSKPPTSAFGPSPGFSRSGDSALPALPSHQILSNPSSPLVASPQSANPRSPTADFVSVEFRERSSLQLSRGLSEQEKAEKWNALLEKSEQAGGTLHLSLGLSPGQLDSDQLTLSSSISVDP